MTPLHMDTIKKVLNSYSPVSEKAWIDLSRLLEQENIRKKNFYIKEGKICSRIGFINSGICRVYYEGQNETQKTVYFNFIERNPIVSDFESFITKKPSLFTVQAITDCEILSISRSNLYKLYDEHPSIERLGRVLAEKHYVDSMERIRTFHADAKSRYKFLLAKYPQLIKEVPANMIASYLDIRDSSLSRIKRGIFNFPKKLS
jgi:CRP-like cAMP-binding protein